MATTDGILERTVRVETQLTDLKQDVSEVKADTKQIKEMLGEKFMQRSEVQAIVAELKIDFSREQEQIVAEVKNLKRRRWFENIGSASAAVALTFLIQRALGTI